MNKGKKRRVYILTAVGLGILMAVALAEILAFTWIRIELASADDELQEQLRVLMSNERRWQGHPYSNYIPKPGYSFLSNGRVITRHNALGFRGEEFPVEKPAGTYRIAMIGGSAVYSSRVPNDFQTIPAQLQATLRRRGFENVQVINGGVSAHSTAEALTDLQFRILELSPDLVIVYEAINDLHNRYVPPELLKADNTGRLMRWQDLNPPWWSTTALGQLVVWKFGLMDKNYFLDSMISAPTYLGHTAPEERTKNVDYDELLKKNTPRFFRENLLSLIAICRVRGIKILLTSYGFSLENQSGSRGFLKTKNYLAGLREMNETARELARKQAVPFFDYEAVMPKSDKFWRDEIHVNASGAELTAQLFADELIGKKLVAR